MTTRDAQYTQSPKALYLALELSSKTWKLGMTVGFGQKARERNVSAGDLSGLKEEIDRAKKRFGLARSVPVYCCYEAGRDGFWIHRALGVMGTTTVNLSSMALGGAGVRKTSAGSQIRTGRGTLTAGVRHERHDSG